MPPQKLVIETVYVKEPVPEELLRCTPVPRPPLDIEMQSEVAEYIVEIWGSATECFEKMQKIREGNERGF